LYFTGDKGMEYVVATRIGVMNAETGEILWQQQIEKTGGLPNAPQVNNDKLYVLTVNKELYIFQKENPSI
jgi:outer membrane protein assembly factor BamB